jgi:hypothetical protein
MINLSLGENSKFLHIFLSSTSDLPLTRDFYLKANLNFDPKGEGKVEHGSSPEGN